MTDLAQRETQFATGYSAKPKRGGYGWYLVPGAILFVAVIPDR